MGENIGFPPRRSGFESHQGRGIFFKTMHHFLVTNFHIRKMGARPGGRLLGVAASSACDMFSWYRCLGVVLVFPASRLVGWEFLSGRAIS